ncbi:hypothetical protein B0H13DRAFT_1904441 [Mycena leptocephala]|nr:hypothetical protein B0H13DRAFT_1904441 [Mycena leptocephala]
MKVPSLAQPILLYKVVSPGMSGSRRRSDMSFGYRRPRFGDLFSVGGIIKRRWDEASFRAELSSLIKPVIDELPMFGHMHLKWASNKGGGGNVSHLLSPESLDPNPLATPKANPSLKKSTGFDKTIIMVKLSKWRLSETCLPGGEYRMGGKLIKSIFLSFPDGLMADRKQEPSPASSSGSGSSAAANTTTGLPKKKNAPSPPQLPPPSFFKADNSLLAAVPAPAISVAHATHTRPQAPESPNPKGIVPLGSAQWRPPCVFRVRQRREPRGYVALVFSHPGSICCLGFPTFRATRSKSNNLETNGVIVLSSAHRSVPPSGSLRRTVKVESFAPTSTTRPGVRISDFDTKVTTPLLSPELDEVESPDRKKFVPHSRARLAHRKYSL